MVNKYWYDGYRFIETKKGPMLEATGTIYNSPSECVDSIRFSAAVFKWFSKQCQDLILFTGVIYIFMYAYLGWWLL